MTTGRVFVSHHHGDVAFCRPFVEGLRAHGLDVWYDETNLLAGALRERIEAVLQTCEHFVVVLSPGAVASKWVNAEIDAALELERTGKLRTFLPVIGVACEVPLLLQRYKRIGGPANTGVSVEEAVQQTVAALMAQSAPLPLPATNASGPPPASAGRPGHNDGIIVTGGTINAGALAVGAHARAIQHLSQADQALARRGWVAIQQQLDALARAIATQQAALTDSDEVERLLDAVAQELTKDRPNGAMLRVIVQGLAARLGSSGVLAAAVDALGEALAALF